MKKFSLSTQLLILTVTIIIVASALFGILMFTKLDGMADTQALRNLTTVVTTSKDKWSDSSITNDFTITKDSEMNIGFIRLVPTTNSDISGSKEISNGKTGIIDENGDGIPDNIGIGGGKDGFLDQYTEYLSDNYEEIVGDTQEHGVMQIVSSAQREPYSQGSATKSVNDKTIYLAYEVSSSGIIFIAITNSEYAHSLRSGWMIDISIIFIVVILLAGIAIYIWSKYYTTRLFRLNSHINSLDKTNYEKSYIDNGSDELAVLSRSVDNMRQTIVDNEGEKREMLQNVSHDFKTPISVIVGYAEAIKDGVEDPSKADVIIEQADVLKKKVLKLLQYNKLEYLEKTRDFEKVSMKSVIEHVIYNYKFLDGIEVITNLDDTNYVGYEENFYTVVDNIMENAKRYAKSRIEITLNDGVLTFYNDGDPIDEKFLNAAFKAYEMGSKGQFGLGMSIVKKTLDFFNYEISVENKNPGVMFTIKKKEFIDPSKL